MWYTTDVGDDVTDTTMDLAVQMSHPGTEHRKELRRLIGYLKGKYTKCIITRKPKALKADMFCDSKYATDKETINSVSGLVAILGGTLLTYS